MKSGEVGVQLDWLGQDKNGNPVLKVISTLGNESLTRTGTPAELDEGLFREGLVYRGLQGIEVLALAGTVKLLKDLALRDTTVFGKVTRAAVLAVAAPTIVFLHQYNRNRLSRIEAIEQRLAYELGDE